MPRPPYILARMRGRWLVTVAAVAGLWPLGLSGQAPRGLTSPDLYRLLSVGNVEVSPDGARVAYAVVHNDEPGRPYAIVTC